MNKMYCKKFCLHVPGIFIKLYKICVLYVENAKSPIITHLFFVLFFTAIEMGTEICYLNI